MPFIFAYWNSLGVFLMCIMFVSQTRKCWHVCNRNWTVASVTITVSYHLVFHQCHLRCIPRCTSTNTYTITNTLSHLDFFRRPLLLECLQRQWQWLVLPVNLQLMFFCCNGSLTRVILHLLLIMLLVCTLLSEVEWYHSGRSWPQPTVFITCRWNLCNRSSKKKHCFWNGHTTVSYFRLFPNRL